MSVVMKVLSGFAVRFRSARSTDARAVAVIRRCPNLIDTWLEAAFDQEGNSRLRPITNRRPLRANAFRSVWFAHQRIGPLWNAHGVPVQAARAQEKRT